MKKQMQKGFTLIELVVVIVILGILAAVAIPKFVDLSKDARTGVMKGVEGAMRSADMMIYAKSAAAGISSVASVAANATAAPLPIQVNGVAVGTAYGYALTTTELLKAMTLNPADDFDTATPGVISHKKATTPGNCKITYTAATGVNVPPTYVADYSGC